MSNNLKKNRTEESKVDMLDYLDKFSQWIEHHAKNIVVIFLGFTLLIVSFWGVSAMKSRALNVVAKEAGIVNRRIDLLEKAISKVKDKESKEFKTNKEAEVLKIHGEVLSLLSKYFDKSVSDFTAVRWAAYLVSEEKTGLALEALNKLNPEGERELSAASLFLKASILSKQGNIESAILDYDKILNEPRWKVFHGEALIQKGSLLQSRGQVDEAIALFNQAKNLKKKSDFSKDAVKYQRLLQLKKKHPKIFKIEG